VFDQVTLNERPSIVLSRGREKVEKFSYTRAHDESYFSLSLVALFNSCKIPLITRRKKQNYCEINAGELISFLSFSSFTSLS